MSARTAAGRVLADAFDVIAEGHDSVHLRIEVCSADAEVEHGPPVTHELVLVVLAGEVKLSSRAERLGMPGEREGRS